MSTDEAEQVILNEEDMPYFKFAEKGEREKEDLYAVYGRTVAGRYLIIFFINKSHHMALIISVRDMTEAERKLYARR